MEAREMAKLVCKALDEKKAEDIRVIDIHEVSTVADYFIIASAANINQLGAMQDAVDEAFYKNQIHARAIEGSSHSTWILMDYEDIVIHLFSREDRLFYDLERIWKDGVQLSPEEL